jgi:hypothetical protein
LTTHCNLFLQYLSGLAFERYLRLNYATAHLTLQS